MITKSFFGKLGNKNIDLVKLTNDTGFSVSLISYGAAVQSIMAPDRNGKFEDVVLGFDTIEGYASDTSYIGVVCGRYANRIKDASFAIGSNKYSVGRNEGNNCLHGGISGFNRKIWTVKDHPEKLNNAVVFCYVSPEGEEGFPGKMETEVTYILDETNTLTILYRATVDQPNYINLTNHSYFNLSGGKRNILDHELMICSHQITENDKENIPTGKILPVVGTAWDFTSLKKIGVHANQAGGGYDHNFVLDQQNNETASAVVLDKETGRKLECFTTEPGIQVYTANHLNGVQIGKNGIRHEKHFGVCLEAQHFPDSMHHTHFPDTLLLPGKIYQQTTRYRFSNI